MLERHLRPAQDFIGNAQPLQFELLEALRSSMLTWLERRVGMLDDFAFPSRIDHANHISTRQYACTARSKPAGRHAAKRQLKTLESGMTKRSNPAANHGANRHLITA